MNDEDRQRIEQMIDDVKIIHDYYINKARYCYYFIDFLQSMYDNDMSSDILNKIIDEELAEWLTKV